MLLPAMALLTPYPQLKWPGKKLVQSLASLDAAYPVRSMVLTGSSGYYWPKSRLTMHQANDSQERCDDLRQQV